MCAGHSPQSVLSYVYYCSVRDERGCDTASATLTRELFHRTHPQEHCMLHAHRMCIACASLVHRMRTACARLMHCMLQCMITYGYKLGCIGLQA